MGTLRVSYEASPPADTRRGRKKRGTRFFRRSPLPRKFLCAKRWNNVPKTFGKGRTHDSKLDEKEVIGRESEQWWQGIDRKAVALSLTQGAN